MAGPNYAAVRAGIAAILSGVPMIRTVFPYERAQNWGGAQLPLAMIWHQASARPGLKDAQSELGRYDYTDTWFISVYFPFTDDQKMQADIDTCLSQLRSAFDGDQLIDPNGPGVVDLSAIVACTSTPLIDRDNPVVLFKAELQTLILT